MYFHIELRGPSADELSTVLGKHPERLFEWECLGSMVRVFFPLYEAERARAVVLFWPDVRGMARKGVRTPYVSEVVDPRAYCLNSLFCQALRSAFNAPLHGNRPAPPALLERKHATELVLSPLCTYLSPERIQGLFEPLGYTVSLTPIPSPDFEFAVRYPRLFELKLAGEVRILDALRQLLVLLMVMDSDRHDFMGQPDLDRLKRFGADWLETHPERMFIISRYLIYRRLIDGFAQVSSEQESEIGPVSASDDGYDPTGEPAPVRGAPDAQRIGHLVTALTRLPASPRRFLQVGCGDARILSELVGSNLFDEVVVMDPSPNAVERARKRLERSSRFSHALRRQPTRFDAIVSALGYADARLHGFDAVFLHDPVERFEASRLELYLNPIFDVWSPGMIILLAANREWNNLGGERDGRSTGRLELDRLEFERFCQGLVAGRAYRYEVQGIGPEQPELGSALLMAIFTISSASQQGVDTSPQSSEPVPGDDAGGAP